MQIEFDPAKDALNQKSHGVSLAMAGELEWDLLVCHADNTRHDYYELRMVGFAPQWLRGLLYGFCGTR